MMPAISPQRVSEMEKIASSAAIATSHTATKPVPPPKHPPWTSATVGTGNVLRRCVASAVAREIRTFSSSDRLPTSRSQVRSAPA